MMRRAFTMIELIFVIVIIGILSAIAIPKLVATRDDAKTVSMANDVQAIINEVIGEAVSTASVSLDISSMSRIATSLIAQNKATLDAANGLLKIKMNTTNDCLILKVSKSGLDANLTLNNGAANGDAVCLSLQNKVQTISSTIPLSGKRLIL